ncbi:glycoside hydrolase family 43 protein [Paenibacillus sp. P96]|uniref:Glycoside hydrolase family 43 protein n=1 Tax=Paenibacillus zeirhizosphaerae TaxID=2987519 RepID=A0ABT9FVJ0_9BACL|nr:glycoside hydrolase family 43 protein [Paenibacillus sp. P96]MDP4098744.1 glycoside hydrolase family 43 protein [Paenibacillus sp. P96]
MKQSKKTALLLLSCLTAAGSSIVNETASASPAAVTTADSAPTIESVHKKSDVIPAFSEVTVHDPSVIKSGDAFYLFGSHLASAKTKDLMNWQQISTVVDNNNPLIPNVFEELRETFEWAQSNTLWAADVIQLKDGKYYMYYNACKGDSPRSAMGIAVADRPEGPYKDTGIILKSGMWDEISEDGTIYDATIHPNVVDPDVFFDKNGKLWMVYGSYSGGIFIMEMNPKTGKPLPGQGYGKKLLGGNHSRIEAPYIVYNPKTDYYYLYLSFGGLDAVGGYNIRVARSKNPDGPYVDSAGKDMINAKGADGTLFDDASIAPYGTKLAGNFEFTALDGEEYTDQGYVSPGHNSVYVDPKKGETFIFFHTRFPGRGEEHQVRVHRVMMNEDGWPVIAPHRYAGETEASVQPKEIPGVYKYVNHGKDISADIKPSAAIALNKDGKVTGAVSGTWKKNNKNSITLTLNGTTYKGKLLRQWDNGAQSYVPTFSALSGDGTAVWGSQSAE